MIINIAKYVEAISSISIFRRLTTQEINDILATAKCQLKSYEKDQIVYLQNEICNNISIILEGQVLIQNIGESGNVLTINTLFPRDIIGANLVFSSKNYYPMTVVAMTKSIILHIKKELVLELCKSNEGFMVGLMTLISDKSIALTDKISAIASKTIRESMIDFLQYEYHIQKSRIIRLNISKKDLAERFGVQRSSLSRELNKMRSDGLIEYDARTITLKDIEIGK